MNVTTDISIVLRDGAEIVPVAHTGSGMSIGAVRFGSLHDPRLVLQSQSVEALLAVANACQEAARLLRREQLKAMRRAA